MKNNLITNFNGPSVVVTQGTDVVAEHNEFVNAGVIEVKPTENKAYDPMEAFLVQEIISSITDQYYVQFPTAPLYINPPDSYYNESLSKMGFKWKVHAIGLDRLEIEASD